MSLITLADAWTQNKDLQQRVCDALHLRIQDELLGLRDDLPEEMRAAFVVIYATEDGGDWTKATRLLVVSDDFGALPGHDRSVLRGDIVRHAFRWAWARKKGLVARDEAEQHEAVRARVTEHAYGASQRLRETKGYTFAEAWAEGYLAPPIRP